MSYRRYGLLLAGFVVSVAVPALRTDGYFSMDGGRKQLGQGGADVAFLPSAHTSFGWGTVTAANE